MSESLSLTEASLSINLMGAFDQRSLFVVIVSQFPYKKP